MQHISITPLQICIPFLMWRRQVIVGGCLCATLTLLVRFTDTSTPACKQTITHISHAAQSRSTRYARVTPDRNTKATCLRETFRFYLLCVVCSAEMRTHARAHEHWALLSVRCRCGQPRSCQTQQWIRCCGGGLLCCAKIRVCASSVAREEGSFTIQCAIWAQITRTHARSHANRTRMREMHCKNNDARSKCGERCSLVAGSTKIGVSRVENVPFPITHPFLSPTSARACIAADGHVYMCTRLRQNADEIKPPMQHLCPHFFYYCDWDLCAVAATTPTSPDIIKTEQNG